MWCVFKHVLMNMLSGSTYPQSVSLEQAAECCLNLKTRETKFEALFLFEPSETSWTRCQLLKSHSVTSRCQPKKSQRLHEKQSQMTVPGGMAGMAPVVVAYARHTSMKTTILYLYKFVKSDSLKEVRQHRYPSST